jgi:hypothetical protein
MPMNAAIKSKAPINVRLTLSDLSILQLIFNLYHPYLYCIRALYTDILRYVSGYNNNLPRSFKEHIQRPISTIAGPCAMER